MLIQIQKKLRDAQIIQLLLPVLRRIDSMDSLIFGNQSKFNVLQLKMRELKSEVKVEKNVILFFVYLFV